MTTNLADWSVNIYQTFFIEKFEKKSQFFKKKSNKSVFTIKKLIWFNKKFEAKKSYLRVVQVVVLRLKGFFSSKTSSDRLKLTYNTKKIYVTARTTV
jgi:hypothetical protein